MCVSGDLFGPSYTTTTTIIIQDDKKERLRPTLMARIWGFCREHRIKVGLGMGLAGLHLYDMFQKNTSSVAPPLVSPELEQRKVEIISLGAKIPRPTQYTADR